MSKTTEIIGYIAELGMWMLPKLVTLIAVLTVIWGVMSWHDIVSDNLTSGNPASEGNMFVEIMEVTEWFN